MISSLLIYTFLIICVALVVSFYTLFERKVMGSSHNRLGPSIVSVWGILQPFSDAIKLFSKETSMLHFSNYVIYILSPSLCLSVGLIIWFVYPLITSVFMMKYPMLAMIIVMGMGIYSFLGMSWSSNSNYAMIGALRCVAQSISYEVSLIFILMSVVFLSQTYGWLSLCNVQEGAYLLFVVPPLFIVWLVSCLAETNRSPFDFAESESELVSGFNVEYGSGAFAMMFISEYSMMIFFSMISVCLFMGLESSSVLFYLCLVGLMYCFIWIRVSYPRTRYDKLMSMAWIMILPSTLFTILVLIMVTL